MFLHPQSVCMTYMQHWCFAMWVSSRFAVAALQSLIHAFIPDIFVNSTSIVVRDVKKALETAGCR